MTLLQSQHFPATEDTPEVLLDAALGVIKISGRSLPENAWAFYKPILEWTRAYCSALNQPTNVELQLDYFNSSSGRYLYEILTILEQETRDRSVVSIRWIVEKDDELMVEKGEELMGLLDLKFEIVVI